MVEGTGGFYDVRIWYSVWYKYRVPFSQRQYSLVSAFGDTAFTSGRSPLRVAEKRDVSI